MTKLVGILNKNDDSFSDGGQYSSLELALVRTAELYKQGATFIDVGAESTRPGARSLNWQEEVDRLDGYIQQAQINGWNISIDSYHPETIDWVSRHLDKFIINDVTGLRDPKMREIAARTGSKVIISHLPRNSDTIQEAHANKPIETVDQVVLELKGSIDQAISDGIARRNIIVDPGIGFGKTMELNWQLLEFAKLMPEFEVMIGYSRKRFLGENRMNIEPNLAAGKIAARAGAAYLRVHDVVGHLPLIKASQITSRLA